MSPTGLQLPANLSQADWEEVGYTLDTLDGAMPWAWGDWLCARPKGMEDTDAVQISGRPWETLRVYRWVAERVKPVTRVTGLSWTHHRIVADLEDWEQARMLERAVHEHMSKRTLESEVKALSAPAPAPAAEAAPPAADNDVVASELVDPVEELEREYGIERSVGAATPKNAVRAAVRESVKALSALTSAVDAVTTWPSDLAAEFTPVWDAASALGDRFTKRQEEQS